MCNYLNGTWACRGEGYLWDADADGYDPAEQDRACPKCNTAACLKTAADDAAHVSESTTSACGFSVFMTGFDIWHNALSLAIDANQPAALAALREIGTVRMLLPAENEQGFEQVEVTYR